ncbi:sugar O-acetyltransferase [Cognatiyoonia sp.]|uniref:sugar O-acetyltransferase n=1 Tax=Cognatiyoonia sp. TaxID=2211652 RepID=UPI003F6A4BE8
MTEYEKLLAGEPYNGADAEILDKQMAGIAAKEELDKVPEADIFAWIQSLAKVFGAMDGPSLIQPPFKISFGSHVRLGKWCYVNKGATFLDDNFITLGDHVAVGPNVQFITATHPLRSEDRIKPKPDQFPPFDVINIAKPITVGDHAWIGAGAIIMPGVTIGARAVVGAGAVVTKDVPASTVVVGNPARFLKNVDE